MKTLLTSLAFFLVTICSLQVHAVTTGNDLYGVQEVFNHGDSWSEFQLLAENKQESESGPQSGELVIPGASKSQGKEKKCVTVCDEWGKDCVINPKTGTRKCRRMCKSFGQECI